MEITTSAGITLESALFEINKIFDKIDQERNVLFYNFLVDAFPKLKEQLDSDGLPNKILVHETTFELVKKGMQNFNVEVICNKWQPKYSFIFGWPTSESDNKLSPFTLKL